jgi:pentatricopeptide repeat protein
LEAKHETILSKTLDSFVQSPNPFHASKLIKAIYDQKRDLSGCFHVYRKLLEAKQRPDLFVFTALLTACRKHGQNQMAVALLEDILRHKLTPDLLCMKMLLSACAETKDVQIAKKLFVLLKKANLRDLDQVDYTRLIQLLADGGAIVEAGEVLDIMGSVADSITYKTVLNICAKAKDLELGKKIHAHLTAHSTLDSKSGLAALNMYIKCGEMKIADSVFNTLVEGKKVDLAVWNTIISGYANTDPGKARTLFQGTSIYCISNSVDMTRSGVKPDAVTYTCLLPACTDFSFASEIKKNIQDAKLKWTMQLTTALLTAYSKFGQQGAVNLLFNEILQTFVPDAPSWNIVMKYTLHHRPQEVFKLYSEMSAKGVNSNIPTFHLLIQACCALQDSKRCKQVMDLITINSVQPDIQLWTAVVDMLSKCESLKSAENAFAGFTTYKMTPDVAAYTILIKAYIQHNKEAMAINTFHLMLQQGIIPNTFTIVAVLKACAVQQDTATGYLCLDWIQKLGIQKSIQIQTSLITFYVNCRKIEKASSMFQTIRYNSILDPIGYAAMISALHNVPIILLYLIITERK